MSPGLSVVHAILGFVRHTWGKPAGEAADGWVVVDVETSGFHPRQARVLSIAALALDADGQVENSVVSLLNPGVDPGPTHIHGITADMLVERIVKAMPAPAKPLAHVEAHPDRSQDERAAANG